MHCIRNVEAHGLGEGDIGSSREVEGSRGSTHERKMKRWQSAVHQPPCSQVVDVLKCRPHNTAEVYERHEMWIEGVGPLSE